MTSTIKRLTARAVLVPMTRALHTSTGAITRVPFTRVDLETSTGAVGRGYLFCVTPLALRATVAMLEDIAPVIAGQPAVPYDIEQLLEKRFTLLGVPGIVAMALAGIDMALWDARAIEAGKPLAELLGGSVRPVRAYNSCGLGLMGPDALAREATELLAGGFRAVKLRLGYATLEEDLAAVHAVKAVLPAGTALMTDYNQALDPTEAIRRGHALDALGLAWIEEPIRADDHAGCARVAAALETPVQIGENYWGPRDMGRAIAAQASDYTMPDLMRIGGVTGWMRSAAIAGAAGAPLSSHLYPIVSSHLLRVSETADWLEASDWANPILATPLEVKDGYAIVPDTPGSGIDWNEEAVKRLAL